MSRVLVVDDEPGFARALAINLRARDYTVDIAGTGAAALAAAAANPPDLVILDLGLPDLDGIEVVRGLRAWLEAPILVLSARQTGPEKVAALDAGADDFVTKPFGIDELLARVRAALRRGASTDASPAIVETASFTMDISAHRITANGRECRLTPTEWHLLEVLARRPGQLVTQRHLLQEVWGPAYGTESNYLRVYISQLRRKLEKDPGTPRHIITEPGVGYRFEV